MEPHFAFSACGLCSADGQPDRWDTALPCSVSWREQGNSKSYSQSKATALHFPSCAWLQFLQEQKALHALHGFCLLQETWWDRLVLQAHLLSLLILKLYS